MANTATLLDTISMGIGGSEPIKVYSLNISSTATDLLVYTPKPTNRVYLLGQFLAEGTAATLSYYSVSPNLTGTVKTTINTTAISGTATLFSTDFLSGGPNFSIVASGAGTLVVSTVGSATQITTATSATATKAAVNYKRRMLITNAELTTNQPIYDKVTNGFILCTRIGDALVVQSSGAISTNNWLMHIAEAPDGLVLRGL